MNRPRLAIKSASKIFKNLLWQYFGNVSHDSATPEASIKTVKVKNHPNLRDTKLTWYSLSITRRFYFYGLKCGFRIHDFRLILSGLIVEVLAILEEFLQPSGYRTMINCTFPFNTTYDFCCFHGVMAQFKLGKHKFRIRPRCTFICTTFKSQKNSSNAQRVSALTTTILPTTSGTFRGLNNFGHEIYAPQTSTCLNIGNL